MPKKILLTITIMTVMVLGGCKTLEKEPIIPMKLESPVFTHNQYLPTKYTCDGTSVNPSLKIADVPDNAKSLVLIMDDPDAPNGDFVHWIMWNIDPKTIEITEDSVPTGATQGINSGGENKYYPPCPPTGAHRYFFKLYALDTLLPADPALNKDQIRELMEGHILERVILRGYYERAHSENY